MSPAVPVVWKHPDGRMVEVYPDKKVRHNFFPRDLWPALWRATVPHLTDDEWYGTPPGEGWILGEEGRNDN